MRTFDLLHGDGVSQDLVQGVPCHMQSYNTQYRVLDCGQEGVGRMGMALSDDRCSLWPTVEGKMKQGDFPQMIQLLNLLKAGTRQLLPARPGRMTT